MQNQSNHKIAFDTQLKTAAKQLGVILILPSVTC